MEQPHGVSSAAIRVLLKLLLLLVLLMLLLLVLTMVQGLQEGHPVELGAFLTKVDLGTPKESKRSKCLQVGLTFSCA